MNVLVLGLAVCVALLLLPLAVASVRQRALAAMALRNIRRRPGEALLVVAGALLGTAIIASSFVVGDIVGGSITDVARTRLGPVDVTVTPADGAAVGEVRGLVEAAGIDAIDGLLTVRTATAAIEAPDAGRVLPRTSVLALDVGAGAVLGGDPSATGLAAVASGRGTGGVVLNERTAAGLQAAVGDRVQLHAYGTSLPLAVTDVVPEVGLAGYAGMLVAPGVLDGLASGASAAAAPPRAQLLVSLDGGVLDSAPRSDAAVTDLRAAVAQIPGVEVEGVKAAMLENAERQATTLTELFAAFGAFSVLAGVLLLINLFVMLAEERKSELGMLRALGFTRRRLAQVFALEGAVYALAAAAVGAVAGVAVGWLVAVTAGRIFGLVEEGLAMRLVVEPASVAVGALTGLTISLLTIWLTSGRIARLNVIRAIRDLPEPPADRVRARTIALAGAGLLAGIAVSLLGHAAPNAIALLAGVPIAAFSAGPLLRTVLPERLSRVLVAGTALGWGLAVLPLFSDVLGAVELQVFVVQGVVLTAGAVSLATTLDPVWSGAVERLASHGRGLALRLGLSYPLARRFRTALLLSMFSLVIFTVALLAAVSTALRDQAQTFVAQERGGYDLLVDSNPANPVDASALAARDDVVGVAALARTFASFETRFVDEPRAWPISGIDDGLLARDVPALSSRDAAYARDADAYRAVLADPRLVIVDDGFLQEGGPNDDRIRVGDTFTVVEPDTGRSRPLTAVGVTASSQAFNGVLASRTLTRELFGAQDVAARHYVAVADGVDPDAFARDLDAALLTNGADAQSFAAIVDRGLAQQTGFFGLLQAFLGLGLLVGIAGLGVVMVRAVRERRRDIGILRAMGVSARTVRAVFLAEAGLIAVQGTAIGVLLGLVTARQLMTSSEAFGDTHLAFRVPWLSVAVIVILPLLAALAATAWPASRAAATRPAVAIRDVD